MSSGPAAALLAAALAPLALAQPALRGRLAATQDAGRDRAARALSDQSASCALTKVDVFTGRYAGELSWSIAPVGAQTPLCAGGGEEYADWQHYEVSCCLPYGAFELTCADSMTDGWNGGSIVIDGVSYCGPTVAFGSIAVPFELPEPTATVTETPFTSTMHSTTETATGTTVPECVDFRPDGQEKWFDSYGPEYDCQWYGADVQSHPFQNRCWEDGWFFENFNMTAVQACCACGGGVRGPPTPAPAPTAASNCSVSEVVLQTRDYGQEVHWEIVPLDSSAEEGLFAVCSGPQPPGLYGHHTEYVVPCCLPGGSYALKCLDQYGDGWNGGSLQIAGVEYCGESSFNEGHRHDETLHVNP